MNYRINGVSGKYEYMEVGEWMNSLKITPNKIRWFDGQQQTPNSICSETCKKGEIKNIESVQCCWICRPCKIYEITVDDFTCRDCGEGRYPNEDRRSCYEVQVTTSK